MLAEERRLQLVDWTRRDGRVDAGQAARKLRVATETVRRDLDVLERRGVLRRVHGGAIALERFTHEYTITERENLFPEAKRRIAETAARYIPQRGCVFVDGGTTTEMLANHLRSLPHLLVVTNNVLLASKVSDSGTKVHLLGGEVRPATLSTLGPRAIAQLSEWNASVAFIGVNGVSHGLEMTAFDPDESEVKRAMMARSDERILLADHSKFGHTYPSSFGLVEDLDRVVCDLDTDIDYVDSMKSDGVEVVLA